MAIARFYLKNDVQGVGYRPFILEKILNYNLNGAPKNLNDGRVEVVVEGKREDIEDFYEYLKNNIPFAAKNPGLNKIEYGDFQVMDKRDAALALNLNKWNTAIPVVIDINKNIKVLGNELQSGFDKLGTEIHEGFSGMDKNFERMNETLDNLPEQIAKAIQNNK